jgi:hypothetical protein
MALIYLKNRERIVALLYSGVYRIPGLNVMKTAGDRKVVYSQNYPSEFLKSPIKYEYTVYVPCNMCV